jgi:Domain of unknown function (DUF4202)
MTLVAMSDDGRGETLVDRSAAFAAIDAANSEDPVSLVWEGRAIPKALLQGQRATVWLARLDPLAGAAAQLAARAHHLRRFAIPRASYPEGRPGYLKWRRDQKAAHAAALDELVRPLGISAEVIERAGDLIQRKGLGTDPETQMIEDVACLVFCETDLDELLAKLGEEKTASAIVKTANKMSAAGLALAAEATPAGPGRDLLVRLLG